MAEDEIDEVPKLPPDARLGSLDERLKRAEHVEGERRPKAAPSSAVVRSRGMRVAQGLVGMPLGGAIIGWLLDRLFHTAPWIMLALMFIGFGGAVWDAMKTFGQSADRDARN
ncbi:MAG: synthase protein [Sphingomonadales bacterium]|jgi:ATP synthase protein I|nr:synthase protein [Sphingomonadales bacterium]